MRFILRQRLGFQSRSGLFSEASGQDAGINQDRVLRFSRKYDVKETLRDPEKRRLELEMICEAGLDAMGLATTGPWQKPVGWGPKESDETTEDESADA
jgi:hypothetical protein